MDWIGKLYLNATNLWANSQYINEKEGLILPSTPFKKEPYSSKYMIIHDEPNIFPSKLPLATDSRRSR